MRVIVTLSGGKASAWCADWALKNYPKESVILYFNDTKWEHPDLYRFLNDLSQYFQHPITNDSDGRSPEDLFWQKHTLANNRMPFCSSILKAERLQKFFQDGDFLVFGIGADEPARARRLVGVYQTIAAKRGAFPRLIFPLIQEKTTNLDIDCFLKTAEIKEPILYSLGFKHNNCSGGCIRAGKKHWMNLYEKLPDIYLDRERVEREMRKHFKKDISFFKDETLEAFRGRIERKELSDHYYKKDNDGQMTFECFGVCNSIS